MQVSNLYEVKMDFPITDLMRTENIAVISAFGVAVRIHELFLWMTLVY